MSHKFDDKQIERFRSIVGDKLIESKQVLTDAIREMVHSETAAITLEHCGAVVPSHKDGTELSERMVEIMKSMLSASDQIVDLYSDYTGAIFTPDPTELP